VGGKATHALTAAVLLAATWLVLVRYRDPRARPLLLAGAAIALVMAITGWVLFRGPGTARFLPLDWLAYVQGDLFDARTRIRLFAWLVLLGAMLLIPLLGAISATKLVGRPLIGGAVVALLVSIPLSTISNRGSQVGPNGLYAVHSAAALCLLFGVVAGRAECNGVGGRVRSWLLALGTVVGISSFLVPSIDSGSEPAIVLRLMRPGATTGILLALLIGAVLSRSRRTSLVGRVTIVGLAAMMTVQAGLLAVQLPTSYSEWRRASVEAPDDHLASLVRWTSRHVPADDIIATNHLCSELACREPEYASDAEFVVLMGRRFHVAAPLYALSYSAESDTWRGRDRVATSIEFGRAPTTELAATLREAGVGWFVAERARSGAADWAAVGDVRYENADYLVIELRNS